MILTLLCSKALIFASIEASPTFTTPSKSFDELLDEFMVIENNRKTAIKIAEEVATGAKSNATLNFLKVVREADEVLENIRRYFDAGKVMFDKNKGKSKLNETDLHAPTSVPSSLSFDKILDSFIALEIIRTDAINKAKKVATNQKSRGALNFLEAIGQANTVLENIRHYFDAGKVKLDFEKGESNLLEEDVNLKTYLLREENYLKGQMRRLAKIKENLQSGEGCLPQDMLSVLRPVMDIIKQSEQVVTPLEEQLQVELEKAKNKENPINEA
nr:PREDICTED: uncharacterized protein LOC109040353 isoform X2 [Bemisia tabaci]